MDNPRTPSYYPTWVLIPSAFLVPFITIYLLSFCKADKEGAIKVGGNEKPNHRIYCPIFQPAIHPINSPNIHPTTRLINQPAIHSTYCPIILPFIRPIVQPFILQFIQPTVRMFILSFIQSICHPPNHLPINQSAIHRAN